MSEPIVTYICQGCGRETVFPTFCSDCQLDLDIPINKIAGDFRAIVNEYCADERAQGAEAAGESR